MKARPEYVWEKFFQEPRELIWRMWTDAALFSAWYGPNVETVVHEMRVEKGGVAHIEMKWGDSASQYQKFEYLEVQPQQKLIWLQSATDSEWNSLYTSNWPKILLATLDFHKEAGKDCLHFTWSPYGDASDMEINNFKKARLDMDAGWKAALALFDEVLKNSLTVVEL